MKNATYIHASQISSTLRRLGCNAIDVEEKCISAARLGSDGERYSLTIELYENSEVPSEDLQHFRARVARCYGLPVVYHHGPSIESALGAVQWPLLDRAPSSSRLPLSSASDPALAGGGLLG